MAEPKKVTEWFTNGNYEPIEGEAYAAYGLTARRLRVDYKLGEITRLIVRGEFQEAKLACPEGSDDCQINTNVRTDDSGYPSRVMFHCPRTNEMCGRLTMQAAENCETQVELMVSKADTLAQAQLDKLSAPTHSE